MHTHFLCRRLVLVVEWSQVHKQTAHLFSAVVLFVYVLFFFSTENSATLCTHCRWHTIANNECQKAPGYLRCMYLLECVCVRHDMHVFYFSNAQNKQVNTQKYKDKSRRNWSEVNNRGLYTRPIFKLEHISTLWEKSFRNSRRVQKPTNQISSNPEIKTTMRTTER